MKQVKVQLSPIGIESAAKTVKHLLEKADGGRGAQSAQEQKSPFSSKNVENEGVHKEQIRKIMKFEKVMKKFCKEIGIDKRTLLTMMLGKNSLEDLKNDLSSSRKDLLSQQRLRSSI